MSPTVSWPQTPSFSWVTVTATSWASIPASGFPGYRSALVDGQLLNLFLELSDLDPHPITSRARDENAQQDATRTSRFNRGAGAAAFPTTCEARSSNI
jgi:hypothetical protein